jgi:hypothetical protein
MIEVHDEFCGWPYFQAYGLVKVAAPKKPRKPRRKRSSILADLKSPKYKPRVVPNKKRNYKPEIEE